MEGGVPIDYKDNHGCSPLFHAISNYKYEIAEYLINNGALSGERLEKDKKLEIIIYAHLYRLIKFKKYKMLELLLERGIIVEDINLYTNDRTLLRLVESNGKIKIDDNYEVKPSDKEWEDAYNYIKNDKFEELIKLVVKGKDLSKMYYDGKPAVCIALEFNRRNIVEYLIKKYDCRKLVDLMNGRNALHYAAMDVSNSYAIDMLIEKGFNPNELDSEGNTPLNLACFNQPEDDLNAVIQLLINGANPNLLNKKKQNSLFFLRNDKRNSFKLKCIIEKGGNINQQDIYGNTPLHHQLLHSKTGCDFMPFLKYGANIKLLNLKNQSPLHIAVLANNSRAVTALLENGADINLQDIDGNTVLHYVAKYAPNEKMLKAISDCSKSLDFKIKNNEGKTPLEIGEPNCFLHSVYFKEKIPKDLEKK